MSLTHSIPQLSNSAATAAAFLELGLKEANSAERAFVCCSLCRASDPTPRGEEESELSRLINWLIRVRDLRLLSSFHQVSFSHLLLGSIHRNTWHEIRFISIHS